MGKYDAQMLAFIEKLMIDEDQQDQLVEYLMVVGEKLPKRFLKTLSIQILVRLLKNITLDTSLFARELEKEFLIRCKKRKTLTIIPYYLWSDIFENELLTSKVRNIAFEQMELTGKSLDKLRQLFMIRDDGKYFDEILQKAVYNDGNTLFSLLFYSNITPEQSKRVFAKLRKTNGDYFYEEDLWYWLFRRNNRVAWEVLWQLIFLDKKNIRHDKLFSYYEKMYQQAIPYKIPKDILELFAEKLCQLGFDCDYSQLINFCKTIKTKKLPFPLPCIYSQFQEIGPLSWLLNEIDIDWLHKTDLDDDLNELILRVIDKTLLQLKNMLRRKYFPFIDFGNEATNFVSVVLKYYNGNLPNDLKKKLEVIFNCQKGYKHFFVVVNYLKEENLSEWWGIDFQKKILAQAVKQAKTKEDLSFILNTIYFSQELISEFFKLVESKDYVGNKLLIYRLVDKQMDCYSDVFAVVKRNHCSFEDVSFIVANPCEFLFFDTWAKEKLQDYIAQVK